MVYHVTRRPFWSIGHAGVKFAMTAGVLGLATVVVARSWSGEPVRAWIAVLGALIAAKLAFEARVLRHRRDIGMGPWKRSALLMLGPLAGVTRWRFGLGVLGLAALATSSCLEGVPAAILATSALAALIAGELCERFLFFAAVAKPRMPGGALS
jgi:DMSO reductase anchor subunit